MEFAAAIRNLLDDGCMVLDGALAASAEDSAPAEAVLTEFERRYRREVPGTPPELALPAAMWGATAFVQACRCLVFREIDEEGVQSLLSSPFPGERNAAAHYSVDLSFRFLPDLVQRAKAASREDVLLRRLLVWAAEWPLSSVGVAADVAEFHEPVLDHPSLRMLYADRIIAKQELARLNDPRICDEVRRALGLHADLAPAVLAAANRHSDESNHS